MEQVGQTMSDVILCRSDFEIGRSDFETDRSDFSRSDFGNRSDFGPAKSNIWDYNSELDPTRSDLGIEVRPANTDI